MATWGELLSDIRVDLKDDGAVKRWTDKILWLYAKDAIRDYSTWFPRRIDRAELPLDGSKFVLPSDFIEEIYVEYPEGTFLEKRLDRPGVRLNATRFLYYFVQGGNLYLWGSTPDKVFLTYNATHPVPTSETDEDFVVTIPEVDTELIRLFVKAKVNEQLRGRQAALDRFKMGTGSRDDNPIEPEQSNLMDAYHRKIAERIPGGIILLSRMGRIK